MTSSLPTVHEQHPATRALRDALSEAETAERAAQEAQAAIREALRQVDGGASDDSLIGELRLLARQLRVGSIFAPATPDEFLRRLDEILARVVDA
jgi:hypothetical protein